MLAFAWRGSYPRDRMQRSSRLIKERAVPLGKIIAECDRLLKTAEIDDWDNALNGLQIENSGRITRLGAAVDVSTRVLSTAAQRGINFLIVHHGLFWAGLRPITGSLGRQIRVAMEHDLALYSSHLPLDIHSTFGNNARLAAALGLRSLKPFLKEKGVFVGLKAQATRSRQELAGKLKQSIGGPIRAFNHGPAQTRRIGIVTGAGGSEIYRVAEEGIDTFITGEAPHWAAVAAEELGMNLLLGGHYTTETFGVQALSAYLGKKFGLPWEFIDFPTGL
jgi:dinuclear metal center YbgI/SA1388 family protein